MTLLLDPLGIEHASSATTIDEIAAYLQETLGQQQTAYLAGLRDAKMVGKWTRARVLPRAEAAMRMREAYHAVRLIEGSRGGAVARAWLFGCNSRLDDRAPAYVLRHARDPGDLLGVVAAARAFAGA